MVDANPDVVKRAHDEGHVIANHSYSHANLINLDEKGIQNEVIKTNQKIEKIIGEEPYLLRPPYGSFNSKVKNATGMEIALWNVDSLDWKTRNSNAILKQVKSSVLPHSVILMHDIYSTTADSLDPMIKHLKSQGYEFCFVDELIDVI
nr:polysaccharide deacetylase family protein [Vagococcus penaei]